MAYEQGRQGTERPKRRGSLTLEGRELLTVSGVEEVRSFDEREIAMRTGEGDLCVRGEGMSISTLNTEGGDVRIHGALCELRYEEAAPEKGIWARLFR